MAYSTDGRINEFPDSTLKERADHFEVSVCGIVYALEKLNRTRKKVSGIRKEHCPDCRRLQSAVVLQRAVSCGAFQWLV